MNGHPESVVLTAAIRPQGKEGEKGCIAASPRDNGATFKPQWDWVWEIDTKYGMVVSWNEWSRGEQPRAEVSKDIEPSKEFGDYYLKLLKEEVTAFKAGK